MQGKDITNSTFSQLFKTITGNDFLKTLNFLEAGNETNTLFIRIKIVNGS